MQIKFRTDNAAFEDNGLEAECFYIFNKIRDQIIAGKRSGVILDSNGNTIGRWSL